MNPLPVQVWIVDDDPVFRLILSMMIKRLGMPFHLNELEDGQQFLHALDLLEPTQSSKPQLVFLDLNMPVLSGEALLRELEANYKGVLHGTQLYLLSSSIDPEDERLVEYYSICSGFIVKPIEEKCLNALLTAVA